MTVKELKNILNSYPNDDAYVSFELTEPKEDDSWTELNLRAVTLDPDEIFLSFNIEKDDKERAEFVIEDIARHINEDYTKEETDLIIYKED